MTRPIALVALAAALAGSACVELSEIRQFAAHAGDAGRSFPRLARDLYESCMSQQRYAVAQRADFRFDRFAGLNDADNPALEDGRRTCAPYKREQPALVRANAVLVNYMRTLADLAADRLTAYDHDLDALGEAVASTELLSKDEAGAVTKLAGLLATATAEGYRRRALGRVVRDHDADVQALTSALQRMIERNYLLQIENERVAMRDYYRKLAVQSVEYAALLVQHAGGTAVVNPAPLDEMKTRYEERNRAIDDKAAAARAYGRLLATIARGHHTLSEHAGDLSAKTVLAAALGYARTLQALVGDVERVF